MNVRRLSPQEQEQMQRAHVVDVPQQRDMGLRVRRSEAKFIAPAKPQKMIQLPATMPTAGTDLSGAISAVSGTAHDVSSAKDRALGFAVRFGVFAAVMLVLAFLGAGLFVWASGHLGFHPNWFERTLAFLTVLAAGLMVGAWKLNLVDYRHSAGGIEHHRLDTLESMHERQIAADLEARRMALGASLKMLGVDDDGEF